MFINTAAWNTFGKALTSTSSKCLLLWRLTSSNAIGGWGCTSEAKSLWMKQEGLSSRGLSLPQKATEGLVGS